MTGVLKKRGQKIRRNFSRFGRKTSDAGKKHLKQNFFARIDHVRAVRILVLEWILLVLIVILLGVAQSIWYKESYASKFFVEGGNYTEATLGKINTLNPLFATTSSEKTVSKLLFSTLVAPDYSGHMGLSMVASIRADATGKVWTVKLRDNLVWSDGQPITGEDVIYTIDLIKNPKVNTTYGANLAGVKVETREDKIIFTLPAPFSSFSSALNIPILPKHVLEKVPIENLLEYDFSEKMVTSGPFTFKAIQTINEAGEKVVYMNANARYFKGEPLLKNFAVHAFNEIKSVEQAIKTGAVTATAELTATSENVMKNVDIMQKQTALASGVFAFFNTKSPFFGRVETRRAIRNGIDMRSLRAPLGHEAPLDFPILAARVEGVELPKLPEFDSEGARATIKKMNLQEGEVVRVVTVNNGYLPALAENLVFQLKNLGLNAEITVYEPNQDFLLNVLRMRVYDILVYEVELGSDADLFAYYHSTEAMNGGFNLSNYSNYLVDDLILAARGTTNQKLRVSKYNSLLKYWLDDAPAIGICQINMAYFFNKNVRSFSEENKLIYPTDRFMDVGYWATEKNIRNRTP